MANISISDLYPSDSESLLAGIDCKEGDLINSAVNRALEARGGLSIPGSTCIKPFPPILVGIIYNPNYDKGIGAL
jgi:hypothetical protein